MAMTEKEWNKLKAKEQYGMYAKLQEELNVFKQSFLRNTEDTWKFIHDMNEVLTDLKSKVDAVDKSNLFNFKKRYIKNKVIKR